MPGFELSKWYADCVSEQGDAVVVYHAELRWHAVTIHYSTLLTKSVGCAVRTVYSLRERPAPQLQVDEIRWESKEWEAAGSWRELGRGSDARSSNRIQVVSNGIAWRLAQLRIFQIGQMPAIRGWGYAEHLQLSLAPWRLPIRRLRWGRFVNSTDALVWIDWSGSYNKQVAYLNGSEFCAAEISESSVVLKEIGAELDLDKGNVLREGALGSTALSVIPKLNRLFPDSILNVRECKWLSKAVLRRPGQPDSEGMAIHEVVEWP